MIYKKYGDKDGKKHIEEIHKALKNTKDKQAEQKRNQENELTANEKFLEGIGQL